MRESKIERDGTTYARSLGWLPFKFVSPSQVGVPDKLFLRDGVCVFVEFKAPDGVISKIQMAIHRMMRTHGFPVYIVSSIEDGKKLFNSFE